MNYIKLSILFVSTLILILCSNLIYSQEVDIRLFQDVPMRDGINLSANIYLPGSGETNYPVILLYTPYVGDQVVEEGMYFANEDYVFITLDSRGRGNSEGVFIPYENDGIDGYDAIEWISQQEWCNGNIGMMGYSYKGMVQWMTLKNKPAALKTIIPTASAAPGISFPQDRGGIFSWDLQFLSMVSGKTLNRNLGFHEAFWQAKASKRYKEFVPYKDWDLLCLGERNSVFQTWISHPDFDEYWQDLNPSPDDYRSFDIPILTISGYFDGALPGALKYYEDHMQYGDSDAISDHYLILGPWSHYGTRKPETELGGLSFGTDSKLDMNKLHLEWFDWTHKNGEKPGFLKDRVGYYMMDQNVWKFSSQLTDATIDTITYYISSPSSDAKLLIDAGHLGLKKSSVKDTDIIISDPLDVSDVASYEGSDYYTAPIPIEKKGRLIYLSEVLDSDTPIVGKFEVGLYLSLDVPDTDMEVELHAINEVGETRWIGTEMLRLRYRNGLEQAEFVNPGEVFFCEFKSSFITALEIEKGSRLVLSIGHVNNPDYQKNYNSGKDVSLETEEDAIKGEIIIHHSQANASYIKIPIGLKK